MKRLICITRQLKKSEARYTLKKGTWKFAEKNRERICQISMKDILINEPSDDNTDFF